MHRKRIPALCVVATITLSYGLQPLQPRGDDRCQFLLSLKPSMSSSKIVTGPEHVETVLKHSMLFSSNVSRRVLPKMNAALTKRHGWKKMVSTPGEYVVFRRGGTSVSYMSARIYRHLIWPDGTKLLPVKDGGCVVEYFKMSHIR